MIFIAVIVFSIIAGISIVSPVSAAARYNLNATESRDCEGFSDPHGYCKVYNNGWSRTWGCHRGYEPAPRICIPIGWSHDVPPTAGPCENFSDTCQILHNDTENGFRMTCTRTYRYSIASNICEPWQTSGGVVIHGPCKDFISNDHGKCEISEDTTWTILCYPECKYVAELHRCELINPPTEEYFYDDSLIFNDTSVSLST